MLYSGSIKVNDERSVALIEVATGDLIVQGCNAVGMEGKIQQLVFSPRAIELLGALICQYTASKLSAADTKEAVENDQPTAPCCFDEHGKATSA